MFENKYKNEFRDGCNTLKDDIDARCGIFHNGLDRNAITQSHVQDLLNLSDRAFLELEIIKKVVILLKNINLLPTTKILFHDDLISEHTTHVLRLKTNFEENEHPPGRVWPLLYATAFGINESQGDSSAEVFSDDTTLDLIFGNWPILYADHYHEIGLFNDFPAEELKKIRINNSPQYPHKLAYDLLSFLEISTIADLKKLHIYNKSMLIQFLRNPDLQKKLKTKIEELLQQSNPL